MKTCSACQETKPFSEFYRRRKSVDGLGHRCIDCKKKHRKPMTPDQLTVHRQRQLYRTYGIHFSLIRALYQEQEGCCAICGMPGECPGLGTRKSGSPDLLNIDHDHKTEEIRGLLCSQCNNGLGRFKDSADLLVVAAAYLAKARRYSPARHVQMTLDTRLDAANEKEPA